MTVPGCPGSSVVGGGTCEAICSPALPVESRPSLLMPRPSPQRATCSPAIISPSTSRGVSPGTMPTIDPRYMTAMRSASATTSSSSVETTITGTPESRASTILVCTNSIDPTSSPRVGCAATNSLSSRLSSRASTTFCWLPPESRPTCVPMPWARTSNSFTFSSANSASVLSCSVPYLTNGAPSLRSSMRFSAIVNSAISPSSLRSSGMKPDAGIQRLVHDAPCAGCGRRG